MGKAGSSVLSINPTYKWADVENADLVFKVTDIEEPAGALVLHAGTESFHIAPASRPGWLLVGSIIHLEQSANGLRITLADGLLLEMYISEIKKRMKRNFLST
jgi:hypothetical protein